MSKITRDEIKILYAMAASAGFVDNSNHDDDILHQIVYAITEKTSVKQLTYSEYLAVKRRIEELTEANIDDMITVKQKKKVYALMKQLVKLSPSEISIEERLCGIIRKNLKISSAPKEPLRWVRKKEAVKLIQIIGYYIENEERKQKGDVKDEPG